MFIILILGQQNFLLKHISHYIMPSVKKKENKNNININKKIIIIKLNS